MGRIDLWNVKSRIRGKMGDYWTVDIKAKAMEGCECVAAPNNCKFVKASMKGLFTVEALLNAPARFIATSRRKRCSSLLITIQSIQVIVHYQ
jgi:hypothetical protein